MPLVEVMRVALLRIWARLPTTAAQDTPSFPRRREPITRSPLCAVGNWIQAQHGFPLARERRGGRRSYRAAALLLALISLGGCEQAKQDMYDQPRYKPMAASSLFPDGTSARPLPAGSVLHARGPFAGTSSGRIGEAAVEREQAALAAPSIPYPITRALLRRGQQRFSIYCEPCHSPVGDGDGRVVRRGFPAPPSFHQPRLLAAPDRHFFDVITHGHGIMYPYADRVEPSDRWAIVAYIRALQLSQHAPAAALDPAARAHLPAAGGPP
jgi:mono/diheme cytochrome c family protein